MHARDKCECRREFESMKAEFAKFKSEMDRKFMGLDLGGQSELNYHGSNLLAIDGVNSVKYALKVTTLKI